MSYVAQVDDVTNEVLSVIVAPSVAWCEATFGGVWVETDDPYTAGATVTYCSRGWGYDPTYPGLFERSWDAPSNPPNDTVRFVAAHGRVMRYSTGTASWGEYVVTGAPPNGVFLAPTGGDDTPWINAQIASLGSLTSVSFPADAEYIVNGTIRWTGKSGVTINCNGAKFTATARGTLNRQHWNMTDCVNMTVNDLWIVGENEYAGTGDLAYNVQYEGQHGIALFGCDGVTLNRAKVSDVWGDFLYLSSSVANGWCDGITCVDHTFDRNGRQGVSVIAARNVEVSGGYLGNVRRSVFDIEPNVPTEQGGRDILFTDNDIFNVRLSFLACKGYGGDIGDVTISNNRCTGSAVMVSTIDAPDGQARRGPFTFTGNTFAAQYGTSGQAVCLIVRDVDGLTVTGNTQTLQANRNMALVGHTADCTGVNVSGNTITNGIQSRVIT